MIYFFDHLSKGLQQLLGRWVCETEVCEKPIYVHAMLTLCFCAVFNIRAAGI